MHNPKWRLTMVEFCKDQIENSQQLLNTLLSFVVVNRKIVSFPNDLLCSCLNGQILLFAFRLMCPTEVFQYASR